MVETEASREALRRDLANLQRRLSKCEEEVRRRERELQVALEDKGRDEVRFDDQRRHLESVLEATSGELATMRLKLSGSEGRVNALESQVANVEASKRDLEAKLAGIVSSLRRTIGFGPDSQSQGLFRGRSPSPGRRARSSTPNEGRSSYLYTLQS